MGAASYSKHEFSGTYQLKFDKRTIFWESYHLQKTLF